MKLKVMGNKKRTLVVLVTCALAMLIPTILTIVLKDYRSSLFVFRLLSVIVLASTNVYTFFVFNKQIKLNAMFGITRKETHKKWLLTIIIIGVYVLLLELINVILINIINHDFYEILEAHQNVLVMFLYNVGGFYIYFIMNFFMYLVSSLNSEERMKKCLALAIFICGLLISIVQNFILFLPIYNVHNWENLVAFLTVINVFVGPVVLIPGLVLLLACKRIVNKGEY